MRAVESPESDVNRSCVGFHAEINTSDSWPCKTVTRFCEVSTESLIVKLVFVFDEPIWIERELGVGFPG